VPQGRCNDSGYNIASVRDKQRRTGDILKLKRRIAVPGAGLVISSDIEHETSFSSDLLRKWRQRFGFPNYEQASDGKCGYSRKTVNQLILVKRLLDAGFRPAQIVGKTLPELERLRREFGENRTAPSWSEPTQRLLDQLKRNDLIGLHRLLSSDRATKTLTEFVVDTLAPLVIAVGEAWSREELAVFQEHVVTSAIQRLLHAELATLKPRNGLPRFLFTTVPDEHHSLGLLMAEAVLADQGVTHINLGANTPLSEINSAAKAWQADVVAVSFSFAYPSRKVRPTLVHLRRLLPKHIELWSGGAGVTVIRRPHKGVRVFTDLKDSISLLPYFTKH
jgi:methylmalonyl-CoA mutase cobalamin-binding subunit